MGCVYRCTCCVALPVAVYVLEILVYRVVLRRTLVEYSIGRKNNVMCQTLIDIRLRIIVGQDVYD